MMENIITIGVILVTSIASGLLASACFEQLKGIKASITGKSEDGAKLNRSTKVFLCLVLIISALGASVTNIALAAVLAVILIVGIAKVPSVVGHEGELGAMVFKALGTPFAAVLITKVVISLVSYRDWLQLVWLVAPVAFYVGLSLVGGHTEMIDEDDEEGHPIWVAIGVAVLVVAVAAVAALASSKLDKVDTTSATMPVANASIQTEALAATSEEQKNAASSEESEAMVRALNQTFANHGISEEEKALSGDMVLPQLDPLDSESSLSDYALGPMSEEMLEPMREWLGWTVSWNSYPVDPITDSTMTEKRTHSAKELGYVDYTMSYATAPGFPKDWKEYATSRGMDPDTTEEEAVWRYVGDLTGNYPAFIGMVELFAEAKTYGVKNRLIEGNEFFQEIIDLANQAEEEGKGVTKFLDPNADPAYSKYNFDWQTYRAKFMLWLSLTDYVGRKEWMTVEKSYLGPADNTVEERMRHEFDYTNAAFVRANFTTDTARQTDLPSFVFCFRDKNGYRVSDFFGVNCTNGDAELYAEKAAVRKSQLKQGKYSPKASSSSSSSSSSSMRGSSSSSAKEKSSSSSSKKSSSSSSKKSSSSSTKKTKDKKKSSVKKEENIIDGKDPVGKGTDAYQPTVPVTNWGKTVEEAQYQPTEETKQILEAIQETGEKPNPGKENYSVTPSSVTVVENDDGSTTTTEVTNITNPETGVTTSNETVTVTGSDGTEQVSFTENKEATTPEIKETAPSYDGGESPGGSNEESEELEDEFGF